MDLFDKIDLYLDGRQGQKGSRLALSRGKPKPFVDKKVVLKQGIDNLERQIKDATDQFQIKYLKSQLEDLKRELKTNEAWAHDSNSLTQELAGLREKLRLEKDPKKRQKLQQRINDTYNKSVATKADANRDKGKKEAEEAMKRRQSANEGLKQYLGYSSRLRKCSNCGEEFEPAGSEKDCNKCHIAAKTERDKDRTPLNVRRTRGYK